MYPFVYNIMKYIFKIYQQVTRPIDTKLDFKDNNKYLCTYISKDICYFGTKHCLILKL